VGEDARPRTPKRRAIETAATTSKESSEVNRFLAAARRRALFADEKTLLSETLASLRDV
jgi:hypothetical protein